MRRKRKRKRKKRKKRRKRREERIFSYCESLPQPAVICCRTLAPQDLTSTVQIPSMRPCDPETKKRKEEEKKKKKKKKNQFK